MTSVIYATCVLILATSASLCIGMLAGAWITYAARTGINPLGGLVDVAKKALPQKKVATPEDDKPRGPVAKP